jgi:hypothetical protein
MANELLHKRVDRLEANLSRQGQGGFETNLRALAPRFGWDPEALVRAAHGHTAALEREISADGTTWEGFLYLRDLLLRSERHR